MAEPVERLIRALTKGWPEWMPKGKKVSTLSDMLPIIVYALYYLDFGYENVSLTFERCLEIWEKGIKPALEQPHFGNCIKEPQACLRCQAEHTMHLARIIEEGLKG